MPPLGGRDEWPQALRTLVGIMLGAKQPMFIAWRPAFGLVKRPLMFLL
jgi:hypothetical protein